MGLWVHGLVLAFLCGVALILNRTRIVFSRRLFLVSLVGFVASVLASNRTREDLALFVRYLTVYLGLHNFSVGPFARRPITHGIYLTGLPFSKRLRSSCQTTHLANFSDRVTMLK